MTQFTANRKKFIAFLTCFGKELQDIELRAVPDKDEVEAAVGTMPFYLRARVPAQNIEKGKIVINDLPKVLLFLKGCTDDNCVLLQESAGKTLFISCGNSKIHLPSSSYVRSQREVPLIEKIIKKSEENMWTSWISFPLEYSGSVNSAELKAVQQMAKVIGDKLSCKMDFYATESEILFRAGKSVKGQMFVKVPIIDAKGPPNYCTSTFGYWLPSLMDSLPAGEIDIHTGSDTVLVMKKDDSFLLVIIDQDYEED